MGDAEGKITDQQLTAATKIMRSVFRQALLALYLHGSAVTGGLRPRSDIDLLAVIDRPMTGEERSRLIKDLLRISARHPASPGGERSIEVMVFLKAELATAAHPVRAEFIYGEWLRDLFDAGQSGAPSADPENTLVLAQARQVAVPLLGRDAKELLPEIPFEQVRKAMRDALPALVDGLRGDERNVLLTLARMWRTATTGEFVAKDAAALWAAALLPDQEAATLRLAREAYLGGGEDDWENRRGDAQRTAQHLRRRVWELL